MFYAIKQDKYINEGQAFELDGVQYPANWLNLSTLEEKTALGLEEVVATNAPADERFYWVSQNLNGAKLTYVNTPKDLGGLKEQQINQLRETAYALLAPSDWRVIRGLEIGVRESTEWSAYREAVRTKSNELHAAIDASATVDELIAAVTDITWPNDPNYVATEVLPEVLPE